MELTERSVTKSSNREHQVLLPGRNNPLQRSTKDLTDWDTALHGRTSARKNLLGDVVATKLTMSQHCTLVAQAQQEPQSQQAAAFSMGAVSVEHLMGTFLWHCLHRTCVHPDTQHLGILTAVLVMLPDKSIFPCTLEQNTKLCDLQLPQAAEPRAELG